MISTNMLTQAHFKFENKTSTPPTCTGSQLSSQPLFETRQGPLPETFDPAHFHTDSYDFAPKVAFGGSPACIITHVEFLNVEVPDYPYPCYGLISFLAPEPIFVGASGTDRRDMHYFSVGQGRLICHIPRKEGVAAIYLASLSSFENQMLSSITAPFKAVSGLPEDVKSISVNVAKASKACTDTCDSITKLSEKTTALVETFNMSSVFERISASVKEFFNSKAVRVSLSLVTVTIVTTILIKMTQYLHDLSECFGNTYKVIKRITLFFATLGLLIPAYHVLYQLLNVMLQDLTSPCTVQPVQVQGFPSSSLQAEDSSYPEDSDPFEDAKHAEINPVYETQGPFPKANMLASLVAVGYVFADLAGGGFEQSIGSTMIAQFKKVRLAAGAFTTLHQALGALTHALPQRYRVAVYQKYSIGIPQNTIPQADQVAITKAFDLVAIVKARKDLGPKVKLDYQVSLQEMGNIFRRHLYDLDSDLVFVKAVVKEALTQLRSISQEISLIPDGSNIKLEPFGVWLYGKSGAGKTQFVDKLASNIFGDKPRLSRTFADNVADQFSSGYTGQFVYYMDDFGTDLNALQQSKMIPQLMTWMSCYKSNMNKAFDKTTPFNSHGLILSSNECPQGILSSIKITNPSAVLRRFSPGNGLILYMEPKREFATVNANNLILGDKAKITGQQPPDLAHFNHVNFFVSDGRTVPNNVLLGEQKETPGFQPISYADAMTLIAEQYLANIKSFKSSLTTRAPLLQVLDEKILNSISAELGSLPAFENQMNAPQEEDTYENMGGPYFEKRFCMTDDHWEELAALATNYPPEQKMPPAKAKTAISKLVAFGEKFLKNRRFSKSDVESVAAKISVAVDPEIIEALNPDSLVESGGEGEKDSDLRPDLDMYDQDGNLLPIFDPEADLPLSTKIDIFFFRVLEKIKAGPPRDLGLCAMIKVAVIADAIQENIQSRMEKLRVWYTAHVESKMGLSYFGMAVAAISFVSALSIGFALMKRYTGGEKDETDELANQSKRYVRKKLDRKKRHVPTHDWSKSYVTQGDRKVTPATFPFAGALRNSEAWLSYTRAGTVYRGRVWRTGSTVLFNRHYLMEGQVQLEPVVKLEYRGQEFHLRFRWKEVQPLLNANGDPADIGIWYPSMTTNQAMPIGPDLSRHFATAPAHLDHFGGLQAVSGKSSFLVSATENRVLVDMVEKVTIPSSARFKEGHTVVVSQDAYEYPAATLGGDCGMFLTDGQVLYGIHMLGKKVGGVITHGIAQTVTREMLEGVRTRFETQGIVCCCDNIASTEFEGFSPVLNDFESPDVPAGFIPVALINDRMSVPTQTRLVRTLLKGSLASSCLKVPSPLTKTQAPKHMQESKLSFMAQLQDKFSVRPMDLPIHDFKMVMSGLVAEVPPIFEARVYSLAEVLNPKAVFGDYMKPLPRGTGPGHLWKKPGARGKHHVVDFVEDEYVASNELELHVEEKDSHLRQGNMPYFLFGSFGKDELLALDKINRVGAREITASQVDFCYLYRKYFGAFTASFHASHLKWGHAIGIEVMGPGWDAIVKKMLNTSSVGFSSDVKRFDSTLGAQFFFSFFEAVDHWYQKHGTWTIEDRRARFLLIHAIIFNFTVIGKTVSQSLMGNISGQPGTTDHNTFFRTALAGCTYVALAREWYAGLTPERKLIVEDADYAPLLGYTGFREYVSGFGLGDDRVESVHPSAGFYNYNSSEKYLATVGVTITPANKLAGPIPDTESVLDLEFLSCKTRAEPGLIPGLSFFPVIKQGSLSKAVRYVKPNPDLSEIDAIKSNITDTLERAWFAGPKRFQELKDDLESDLYQTYGLCEVFPTYEELWFRVANKVPPQPIEYETQGITYSTSKIQNHVSGLVDSSFQSNPHNSAETKTDTDASAGMDKPNLGLELGGLVRASAPGFATCQGVTFADPLCISQIIEPTVSTGLGDIDDLAFKRFARLVWADALSVSSADISGSVIATYPICPNQAMVGMSVGDTRATSSLAYLSHMHTFWRGSIRHSFHFLAPGIATCRLALAVLWGVHTVPGSIEAILSQAYVVYDINTGSSVLCAEIPYIAQTELLEVYNGQAEPTEYSAGIIVLVMLNAFRAPEAAADVMYIEHFEGAGSDFEVQVPFGINASAVPVYVNQMYSALTGDVVVNSESGSDAPIVLKTKSLGTSSRPSPICTYPQTFRALGRRHYLIATINANAVIRHGQWSNNAPPTLYTAPPGTVYNNGLFYCLAPFGMWTGSMIYRFVCNSSFYVTYRPVIDLQTDQGMDRYNSTGTYTARGPAEPVAYCKSTVGYVDVLVPFTSKFTGVKIINSSGAPGNMNERRAVGDIIINYVGTPTPMQVFVSGGDGFNFGVPKNLPRIKIEALVAPDLYPVPLASILEKKEEPIYETQMDDPGNSVAPGTSEQIGATMAESDPVSSVVTDMKATNEHKFVQQPQLDFLDFLARPQLIGTLGWTTLTTVGTVLYTRPLPLGMATNTALRAIEAFKQHRMDVVVTLKANGTMMHVGRLIGTFGPLEATDTFILTNKSAQTFVPHAFLDATTSSSVTLRVPYREIVPYLIGTEAFGTFSVRVFAPLSVGLGGNSTIEVSIFVHYEKAQLRILNSI